MDQPLIRTSRPLCNRRQLPSGIDPAVVLLHEHFGRHTAIGARLATARDVHLVRCVENDGVAVRLELSAWKLEPRQLVARRGEATRTGERRIACAERPGSR